MKRSSLLIGLLLVTATALPLAVGTTAARSAAAQPSGAPKLVVILVVDQLRADYLDRYGTGFTGGLRRLMEKGAWWTEAAFPYLNTVTCAGHATIGTGAFPYRHGMVLNTWYDREANAPTTCTEDERARNVSYNGLEDGEGHSAHRMRVRPLGEQIQRDGGRAVSLSLKPRSSIPLAGDRAEAVVWFDDRGGWSTSNAYASRPVPEIKRFVDANPITVDYAKVWERTLDASAYQGEDAAEGEGTTSGWTQSFPHPLGAPAGTPDGIFYSRWQRSPFADEYLGRMGAAAVDALQLGRRGGTDFLGISFSSLDLVGHAFGPRSHEVQDMLVRLDLTIGRLLDHLDRSVGAGSYVVGLSSDHGVAEIPEQAGAGGRQTNRNVSTALTRVLTPVLGAGDHVRAIAYTDIYLSSAARARLRKDRGLTSDALDALRLLPGTAAAFRGQDLLESGARTSPDPILRAAALSYFPDRSGDLVVAPKEHWLLAGTVTTHGSHHAYDQRVPMIVFGAGIRAGRYTEAATPADLAPTLAAVAGVRIDPVDGRVLREALAAQYTR